MKNKIGVMGVFPSFHLIVGHNHFEKSLNSAFRLVKKEQILVTIGIKPSYPSTAYGYIQYESASKNKNGYHVKTFAEKPHETLAKRFIKSGDFLWNAGIFVWGVKSLLLSLEKFMPELHDAIKKIGARIEKSDSYWLLDPLHGTRNFIHQYPQYSHPQLTSNFPPGHLLFQKIFRYRWQI